ncbi:MAG: proline iminopeptidase-family hydrolase [Gemmatimonadota bacterium]
MRRSGLTVAVTCLTLAPLVLGGCQDTSPLPDDGFVDVPGGRVAFRVMGDGPGTPLLVIHGGPGSSSCIYPSTLTGIAEERPVVMYDQLGTGYSDRITDLGQFAVVPRFAEEVTAIREELGLDELHILGHSWGGSVALEYLLGQDPTGVLSVTLVGPLVGTDRWLQDANGLVAQLSPEGQTAVYEAIESGDFSTEAFDAANTEFMAQFGVRDVEAYEAIEECLVNPQGDSGLYTYMWGPSEFVSTGTLRDYDRTADLDQLDLPVLFLVGEYDEARPETMQEFMEHVPGSSLAVIPDAGHVSNVDQPEAFNAAVIDFLRLVEGL